MYHELNIQNIFDQESIDVYIMYMMMMSIIYNSFQMRYGISIYTGFNCIIVNKLLITMALRDAFKVFSVRSLPPSLQMTLCTCIRITITLK